MDIMYAAIDSRDVSTANISKLSSFLSWGQSIKKCVFLYLQKTIFIQYNETKLN